MSNRITLARVKWWEPNGAALGAYWYCLKDASGHIRDWTMAYGIEDARRDFKRDRSKGILPGYRVERRGKVGE